ncbi:MAG: hypothetical protein AVDCRST_MAG59-3324, partial [uncultured Thermomicrobiales bacterium]
ERGVVPRLGRQPTADRRAGRTHLPRPVRLPARYRRVPLLAGPDRLHPGRRRPRRRGHQVRQLGRRPRAGDAPRSGGGLADGPLLQQPRRLRARAALPAGGRGGNRPARGVDGPRDDPGIPGGPARRPVDAVPASAWVRDRRALRLRATLPR